MRKNLILQSLIGPAAFVGLIPSATGQERADGPSAPNFLVILADDYGWNDAGFMGSKVYETPNLDSLASCSMVCTNGYAACQVSSPSRASLLTGLYTSRHGITNWIGEKSGEEWRTMGRHSRLLPAEYKMQLDSSYITIPEVLKDFGYKTFMAGKWHLGATVTPESQGFDINIGGWDAGSPKGGYFSPYDNPVLKDGPDGENLSMRLADETASFLTSMADAGKPFFIYLSFYAVHGPIQTTEELWSKYRDKISDLGLTGKDGFHIDGMLPVRNQQDNPVYAGLIEQMDRAIGRVLRQLKDLGLDDNTIIIFTSDNGGVVSGDSYSTSLVPLRGGKGRAWEGGIRVPFIVHLPHMKEKVVSDTPVSGIDIYPTIVDYAGGKVEDVEGISLRPLLDGNGLSRRALFWHYPHYGNQGGEPAAVMRKGKWKLIYYYETGKCELYDLETDLSETTSLTDRHPFRTRSMSAELKRWLSDTGALMPAHDPMYDPEKERTFLERRNSRLMKSLEEKRQKMLRKGWQPDSTWWGSQPYTID